MLKDRDYDLMQAIAIKSKGLQRYDTFLKDSSNCPGCQGVWQRLKQQDEQQVGLLVDELKKHVEHREV